MAGKIVVDSGRMAQGRKRAAETKRRLKLPRPLKAIRDKCIDCCAGSVAEVKRCHISDCPLWAYRMGRSPKADDLKVRQYNIENEVIDESEYEGYKQDDK